MNLKEFEMSGTNSDTQNEVKRGAWSELEYNLLESNLQHSTSEQLFIPHDATSTGKL